jgi:predicted nucleotidyltransferase
LIAASDDGTVVRRSDALPLPPFNKFGDLPVGVHLATLREISERLGAETPRRRHVFLRLERIHAIARATGHLSRMVVFGSFVTRKADPNDVDVFLLMADTFDIALMTGETRLLFDHLAAETHFGASVFWLRRMATLDGEQTAVEYWQIKRDGQLRGIVEIDLETS